MCYKEQGIQAGQLNQHFIFNALNMIKSAAIMEDKKMVCRMVDDFSCYLRYTINAEKGAEIVPFEKEMKVAKSYANIEMARFPSIHVTYQLEEHLFGLPVMTLQPLLEQAINFGLAKRMQGGEVTIRSRREETHCVVEIENSGRGYTLEEMTQEAVNRYDQIVERIEKQAGGSLELFQKDTSEGSVIRISIPID